MQIHSRRLNTTQGWRRIGDKRIYARSLWEANFGRYLEFLQSRGLIKEWEHEPKTFWFENIKRGIRSYKPDFLAIERDGSQKWYEVKGYYDSKTLIKIKRFRKYYPQEDLTLIDSKWFKANRKKLSILIPCWEKGTLV